MLLSSIITVLLLYIGLAFSPLNTCNYTMITMNSINSNYQTNWSSNGVFFGRSTILGRSYLLYAQDILHAIRQMIRMLATMDPTMIPVVT